MSAIIVYLPGHGHRPDHGDIWDSGAVSPSAWREVELVADVARAAVAARLAAELPAALLAAGTYADRGRAAQELDADLVVQLHADAVEAEAGPDITRVFYWPSNRVGENFAREFQRLLKPVVPWPVEIHPADTGWPGPRWCLRQVKPTSVLVELGFTDGRQGRTLLPQLVAQLGRALALL